MKWFFIKLERKLADLIKNRVEGGGGGKTCASENLNDDKTHVKRRTMTYPNGNKNK